MGMTRKNPKSRFMIRDIKKSNWFSKEIYSECEMRMKMMSVVCEDKN